MAKRGDGMTTEAPLVTETAETQVETPVTGQTVASQAAGGQANGGDAEQLANMMLAGSQDQPTGGATQQSEAGQPAGQTGASGQPTLAERLAQLGFEGVVDERDGVERLVTAYQREQEAARQREEQLRNAAQWAQYGQQYYQQLQDPEVRAFFEGRQGGRGANGGRQTTEAQAEAWYRPPQYNAELVARFRTTRVNEAGEPVVDWKPDTPATVRQQYEARQQFIEDVSNRLVSDPLGAIGEIAEAALAPKFQAMLDEYFGQRVEARERERYEESLVQQISRENADWLYERDPLTNKPNEARLSREGARVAEYLQEAQAIGIQDVGAKWQYAMLKRQASGMSSGAGGGVATQAAGMPGTAPAGATQADRNAEYLKRQAAAGAATQNRGNVLHDGKAGQRAGRRQSSGHDLLEEMGRVGVSV